MNTCPSCGQGLEDDARFCNHCGAALSPSAPQFCSNCGQKLNPDTAFCPNCGTAVHEDAPPSPPQDIQPPDPLPEAEEAPDDRDAPAGPPLAPIPPAPPPAAPTPRAGTFCTNCGERVPDGSAFCPNCHTIIQAEPKTGGSWIRMTGRKKPDPRLLASAAAAVVILIAAIALAPRLFSSPARDFISFQEEAFLAPLLSAMETEMDTYGTGKFSTDMTISAAADSYELNQYLSDSSVVLKLDASQSSLLASGELTLMGSPVLSGTVTYDKNQLGVYLPELDDNYYVMDVDTLMESMYPGSVNLRDTKMPQFSGKEWRALADTYLDLVYTAVTKENLTVSKGETFRLPQLGGSYTGTVYTYRPKAEDIEAMLESLADHLEQDKELRSLIQKVASSSALQNSLDSYGGYMDFDTALDENIRELAWQLRSQAGSIGRNVEDSGFTWTLCMEGREIRMIRIETRAFGQAVALERTGTEAKGCTQLLYQTSYDSSTIYFRNEYTKKGGTYKGEASVNDGYNNSASLRYDADTSKHSALGIPYGSYDLSVPGEGIQYSMEVSAGKSGSTDHVITLRGSEYMFGSAFSRLDLTVNTTSKSSVKKPSKKPTDISDYTPQELSGLMYQLTSEAESQLNAMLYGLW